MLKDKLIFFNATTKLDVYMKRNKNVIEGFDSIRNYSNLIPIFPVPIFCGISFKDRCNTIASDKILYFDNYHLSYEGASILLKNIYDKYLNLSYDENKNYYKKMFSLLSGLSKIYK